MPAEAVVDDRTERKEGKAMIRRGIGLGGRLAAVAFAMALVLSLAGDRGRAATVPAVINGQDPLEVLSLKIRPNIIIVLDSSGSMTSTAPARRHPLRRPPALAHAPGQAVIHQVIQDNQDKVSFQFGHLHRSSARPSTTSTTGRNRFQYYDERATPPPMQSAGHGDSRSRSDPSGRLRRPATAGLQSWQLIYAGVEARCTSRRQAPELRLHGP